MVQQIAFWAVMVGVPILSVADQCEKGLTWTGWYIFWGYVLVHAIWQFYNVAQIRPSKDELFTTKIAMIAGFNVHVPDGIFISIFQEGINICDVFSDVSFVCIMIVHGAGETRHFIYYGIISLFCLCISTFFPFF